MFPHLHVQIIPKSRTGFVIALEVLANRTEELEIRGTQIRKDKTDMSLSADHGISHLEHRTESADQLSELIGKFSNVTIKTYRLFSYRPAGTD